MKIDALSPACGIQINHIDLAKVEDCADRLRDMFDKEGLILFREGPRSKESLVRIARAFGKPLEHPIKHFVDDSVPEVMVIAHEPAPEDVDGEGTSETLIGTADWHTDMAYVTRPNRGALLYAQHVPPDGGLTGFIDRRRVYAQLPESLQRRTRGLSVVKSWRYAIETESRNHPDDKQKQTSYTGNEFPDIIHPLVYDHPITGEKILNVTPQWDTRIVELDQPESDELLEELKQLTTREENAYWHKYEQGDIIAWDNWRMLHAASGTAKNMLRIMYRVTLEGDVEFGRMAAPQLRKGSGDRAEKMTAIGKPR